MTVSVRRHSLYPLVGSLIGTKRSEEQTIKDRAAEPSLKSDAKVNITNPKDEPLSQSRGIVVSNQHRDTMQFNDLTILDYVVVTVDAVCVLTVLVLAARVILELARRK